jgi:hypothetical protein
MWELLKHRNLEKRKQQWVHCCQRHDRCYAIIGTHVSTIEAELHVWSARRLCKLSLGRFSSQFQFSSVQFSARESHGKFVEGTREVIHDDFKCD